MVDMHSVAVGHYAGDSGMASSFDRHNCSQGMLATEGLQFRHHQPPSPDGHAEHCWPCLRVSSNGSSSRRIWGCRSFVSLTPSSRHTLNSCSRTGQGL